MNAPRPQTQPRQRKRAKGQRYHGHTDRDRMQMAFLAGQCMSAGEIAEAMENGLTGGKVGAQLRRYGIKSTRRADEEVTQIRWLRRDRRALEAVAAHRRYDAEEIIVVAMRILLAEPTLFGNLLDEAEMIDEAARK